MDEPGVNVSASDCSGAFTAVVTVLTSRGLFLSESIYAKGNKFLVGWVVLWLVLRLVFVRLGFSRVCAVIDVGK